MADNTPNVPPGAGGVPPAGATPPPPTPPAGAKPGESGKIQPKKETVRINLPPKPTAAPTIKIPAPSAIHAAAPAAAAPSAAPSAAAPSAAAPSAAQKAAAPASAPAARPPAGAPQAPPPARAPAPARPVSAGLDTVDKILAIAAAVVAVAVLVSQFLVLNK
jgi:hypothetical protein